MPINTACAPMPNGPVVGHEEASPMMTLLLLVFFVLWFITFMVMMVMTKPTKEQADLGSAWPVLKS